jgi:Asp-tRNA(Asn)/Glu-tRNA(Gln) amidotransferase A subunit family amidase
LVDPTFAVLPSLLTRAGGQMFCPNNRLAAATGLPAVTVPAGKAKGGSPVGLEFVGAPGSECELLELAGWLNQQLAA